MQRYKFTAAIAATLCVGATAAIHAETTRPEVFSPSGVDQVFNDDYDSYSGSFPGLGYEVIEGHAVAEGDMVLGRVNANGALTGNFQRGLGQSRILDRWTNGIIPYQFSPEVSDNEKELALAAIEHWNEFTSISLIEITDENRASIDNHITFESSNSCASFVGMRGGEQQLWISESCGVGSIIHEIGHAVGLFHEHTRNDRDNFIRVQLENIVAGKEFNFDVLNANSTLLGEYDYGSIMHYGETFFSSNGLNTIEVFGDFEIGQRVALSDGDIKSVNTLYETDLSLMVDTRLIDNDQISADIQVTNEGQMGANQLTLTVDVGGNATWFSMSPNSGWSCNADETLLLCNRGSLAASATSVFTVVANANGTTDSELSAELLANTRETSYDNNGFKTTVTAPPVLSAQSTSEEEPTEDNAPNNPSVIVVVEAEQEPGAPQQALPDNGTAEQLSPTQQTPTEPNPAQSETANPTEESGKIDTANEESSSGGAFSPLTALSLLLGVAVARRRRTQS